MTEAAIVQLPEFITFLFSSKPKFDCYFIVGNKSQGEPERIGGVKLMLMAHSEVFRCVLGDSEIAEKEDVKVSDIHPETFKSMLKYVYGYDATAQMSFNEADNLLYAAEKYMMKRLKDKLATRLMCLLTPQNICSLLNNPACYTHLELDSAITKILQYETDNVLKSPQFLEVSPEGFLKLVQQEGLAVPEIEVWRAAVEWAKYRASTEDGTILRKEISAVEKHILVCTLSPKEITTEVVPKNILHREEVALICQSIVTKEKQDSLTTFCNEIQLRQLVQRTKDVSDYWELNKNGPIVELDNPTFCFDVVTKSFPIKLYGMLYDTVKSKSMEPEGWKYNVDCTVTIREVTNPHIHTDSSEADIDNPAIIIRYSKLVEFARSDFIPLMTDEKPVTLAPHSKYSFYVSYTGSISLYEVGLNNSVHESENLLMELKHSYIPMRRLKFRVVKPVTD